MGVIRHHDFDPQIFSQLNDARIDDAVFYEAMIHHLEVEIVFEHVLVPLCYLPCNVVPAAQKRLRDFPCKTTAEDDEAVPVSGKYIFVDRRTFRPVSYPVAFQVTLRRHLDEVLVPGQIFCHNRQVVNFTVVTPIVNITIDKIPKMDHVSHSLISWRVFLLGRIFVLSNLHFVADDRLHTVFRA